MLSKIGIAFALLKPWKNLAFYLSYNRRRQTSASLACPAIFFRPNSTEYDAPVINEYSEERRFAIEDAARLMPERSATFNDSISAAVNCRF